MKRSTERILVTHAGTLPRPADLMEMLVAKNDGKAYDEATYNKRVRVAVTEAVQKQIDCGVDIVNDGELGKSNFSATRGSDSAVSLRRWPAPITSRPRSSVETRLSFPTTSTAADALPLATMRGSFSALSRSSTSAIVPSKPTSTISKQRSKAAKLSRRSCLLWLPAPWSIG